MDYLLGRRQFWMDCLEANERVGTRVVWGDNSALCNGFNIKDDVPEGGLSPDMEKKKRELQKKMFRSR
jgi:hypothetical protein